MWRRLVAARQEQVRVGNVTWRAKAIVGGRNAPSTILNTGDRVV